MKVPTLDEFQETQDKISDYINSSPTIYSDWLSKELDAEVFLKLECLQPGKSFKIRGATSALLAEKQLPKEVYTASGGNHGLGVAIACKNMEIPCTVVLPTSTSKYRIQLLENHSAKVLLHGNAWDDANEYALNLSKDENILYIHPFADRNVILGQGTIALELIDELDQFDCLLASVGGGGLLTGISLALEASGFLPQVEITAVETLGADSFYQSYIKGELVELPAITSIAKTLGAKKTTPFIFENLKRLVTHSFVVEDQSAVKYMYKFLQNEKILVEPATSCIIAAAFENKEIFKGKRIVFIICGSNVSLEEFNDWIKQYKIDI